MIGAVGNHGDQKTRQIQRVRVRRDRRLSVVGVVATDSLPSSRRFCDRTGRNGLGIASAGGERAGHFEFHQPNTRRAGKAEIVNRRGSHRGIHRNRMAAVNSGNKAVRRAAETGTWCVALHAARMRGSPQFAGKNCSPESGESPLSVCRGGGKNRQLFNFTRDMVPGA